MIVSSRALLLSVSVRRLFFPLLSFIVLHAHMRDPSIVLPIVVEAALFVFHGGSVFLISAVSISTYRRSSSESPCKETNRFLRKR